MSQLRAGIGVDDEDRDVRVLLLSRSPLVRAGLVSMLGGQQDLKIVRSIAGRPGEPVRPADLDVVVVEGGRVAEALSVVEHTVGRTEQGRGVSVVVLTDAEAPSPADIARPAPTAVLERTVTGDQLAAAIRIVAAGYSIQPSPAQQAGGAPASSGRAGHNGVHDTPPTERGPRRPAQRLTPLTRREQQVLELLGHGYSNADISAALVLSESTVKTHVQHVLNKLNLRNRVSAAIYARERGLEPSPGSPQGERWRERGLRPG